MKWAPNTISASSTLMFPVSRLAAIGNASSATRIAVGQRAAGVRPADRPQQQQDRARRARRTRRPPTAAAPTARTAAASTGRRRRAGTARSGGTGCRPRARSGRRPSTPGRRRRRARPRAVMPAIARANATISRRHRERMRCGSRMRTASRRSARRMTPARRARLAEPGPPVAGVTGVAGRTSGAHSRARGVLLRGPVRVPARRPSGTRPRPGRC